MTRVGGPRSSVTDERRAAIDHYNSNLRRRYGLREATESELTYIQWPESDDEEADVLAFPDGLAAAVARYVVRDTPRYAAGIIDAKGAMHVTAWGKGWPTGRAWNRMGFFLASYPLAGGDNFEAALAEFVKVARRDRESTIASLALTELPDPWPVDDSQTVSGALPIVEQASQDSLEQVAWVFEVGVSTLKEWRRRRRAPLIGPRGRPRKGSART